MTFERQNEIWAMLTQKEKEEFREYYYASCHKDSYYIGYESALIDVFGTHNLTAQAEEKPKEESNHIPDTTKKIDYAQYRLDLAKEIAVAMIRNTYVADEIVENVATAANLANEIVKRLKETDNAD